MQKNVKSDDERDEDKESRKNGPDEVTCEMPLVPNVYTRINAVCGVIVPFFSCTCR